VPTCRSQRGGSLVGQCSLRLQVGLGLAPDRDEEQAQHDGGDEHGHESTSARMTSTSAIAATTTRTSAIALLIGGARRSSREYFQQREPVEHGRALVAVPGQRFVDVLGRDHGCHHRAADGRAAERVDVHRAHRNPGKPANWAASTQRSASVPDTDTCSINLPITQVSQPHGSGSIVT
jgi:hypothetical protein